MKPTDEGLKTAIKIVETLRPNVMGYTFALPEHYLLWEKIHKALRAELRGDYRDGRG